MAKKAINISHHKNYNHLRLLLAYIHLKIYY